MEFDQLTVSLLIRRPDAPELGEEQAAALQDAHMAHLADLHESGHLLAAGPMAFDAPLERHQLVDGHEPKPEFEYQQPLWHERRLVDRRLCGWSILRVGVHIEPRPGHADPSLERDELDPILKDPSCRVHKRTSCFSTAS